jgi:hypothetical protein
VVELQTCETGQLFPPVPRQPGPQTPLGVLHTRPDVAFPQSASSVQPHWPPERHWAPARLGSHAAVFVGVHSVQLFRVGSHTNGAGQSASVRHWTH